VTDGDAIWAGLDLGEEAARICVIDNAGSVLLEADCSPEANEITGVLSALPKAPFIGLEAGLGTRLTRQLRASGLTVATFEVRTVRRFLSVFHNKTDASDARGLAEIARLGRSVVSQVHVKTKECQVTRSLLAIRHKVTQQRLATQSIIRSLFRVHAERTVRFSARLKVRALVEEELQRLASEGIDLRAEVLPLLSVWESLLQFGAAFDKRVAKMAKEIPTCRRLQTIPGVGPLLALSFYSAIEDPHRFAVTSRVGAYLGLAPRLFKSGTVSRREGISKRGSKLTRTHLVIGAQVILRKDAQDSALKQWGTALASRIGYRRATIAVARKLAVLMLTIWKTEVDYMAFPREAAGSYLVKGEALEPGRLSEAEPADSNRSDEPIAADRPVGH